MSWSKCLQDAKWLKAFGSAVKFPQVLIDDKK